jgi:hypothetical protein
MTGMSPIVRFPAAARALILLWLFLALAAGKLQLLQAVPSPLRPCLAVLLAALLLAAWRLVAPLRAWVDAVDLRLLVLLHVTRFVGFYFLHLVGRGELPPEFIQAGYGDIFTAGLALLVVLLPLNAALRLRAVTIWNVIGLVDILLVLATGVRLGLTQPAALRPLTELPLSLLPTFLVPLILASHVIIFVRLRQEAAGRPPA